MKSFDEIDLESSDEDKSLQILKSVNSPRRTLTIPAKKVQVASKNRRVLYSSP
jgi:hypothetical protein